MILGAALTSQKGWFSSNEEWLDITNETHWQRLFSKRRNLSNAVAEHVFEHLTEREMGKALFLIHKYLKKKGTLRIAVPDGNHPDKDYRNTILMVLVQMHQIINSLLNMNLSKKFLKRDIRNLIRDFF